MAFIWTESMTTGISQIDGQHQALIQQINRLEEIFTDNPESVQREDILDMFDYLTQYSHIHFGDEERQMETYNCEAAKVNKDAHKQFIEMIAQLREEYRSNGPISKLAQKIHDKLGDWFVNHICTIDSKLIKAIQKNDVWSG